MIVKKIKVRGYCGPRAPLPAVGVKHGFAYRPSIPKRGGATVGKKSPTLAPFILKLSLLSPISNATSNEGMEIPPAAESRRRGLKFVGLTSGALLATAALLLSPTKLFGFVEQLHFVLNSSVLAKSGFFASLSLIFASEIGDKTFFIAALLAMKCGKWISFLGSTLALTAMTMISVSIGYAVQRVPTIVESSEVFGKYLSAASLLYFGFRSFLGAFQQRESSAGDEFAEAEESITEAEESGSIYGTHSSCWRSLLEVAGLIFIAEWGDRSMLATIALGAAQSPLGVAGGACLAHAIATALAVIGGAALSNRISERTVGLVGGILFIIFAIATAFGIF